MGRNGAKAIAAMMKGARYIRRRGRDKV